jgi:hypothetical protein
MTDKYMSMFQEGEQQAKYLEFKKFFERLIELKNEGCLFMIDGEMWEAPFINDYGMGFVDNECRTYYVGDTFDLNPETGEYDVPYIEISLDEVKESITVFKKVEVTL